MRFRRVRLLGSALIASLPPLACSGRNDEAADGGGGDGFNLDGGSISDGGAEDDDGGSPDDGKPDCLVTVTDLDPAATSPLGFVPMELMQATSSPDPAILTWIAGGEAVLTISMDWDGTATFVDLEVAPYAGYGVNCNDYVVLAGTLRLESDDGRLADAFAMDVRATSGNGVSAGIYAEVVDFSDPGIFDPFLVDFADDDMAEVGTLLLEGGYARGGIGYHAWGASSKKGWSKSETVALWETSKD